MNPNVIDLSDTVYRLEGICDHLDYSSSDVQIRQLAYLRVYESMADKERCAVRGTGKMTGREDRSIVLFTITRLDYEGLVARVFAKPQVWKMHGPDLNDVVCRLVTLHQMSGSQTDNDMLLEFLMQGSGG